MQSREIIAGQENADIFQMPSYEKRSKSMTEKLMSVNPVKLKGILLMGLLIVALAIMLFAPIVKFTDTLIGFEQGINGLYLILLYLAGMKYTVYVPAMGAKVCLEAPYAPIIFYTAIMIMLVVAIIVCRIHYFSMKKDSKFVGLLMVGTFVFAIAVYVILLFSETIKAKDLEGNIRPFFKVYEQNATFLTVLLLVLITGLISLLLNPAKMQKIVKNWFMYLILLVPTVWLLIFSIWPIYLQVIMSFKDYTPASGIWGSNWVGFDNFVKMFTDATIVDAIINTLVISLWRLFIGLVPPIMLAIFLFDMGHDRLRKWIQTIIYIPHFFSWTIIFAIAFAFVNTKSGVISNISMAMGGDMITIFNKEKTFLPLLLICELWKELGWGTILYLAALSGVDPSLYEAASVDGAGPMQKLFKITLPSIAPTIVYLGIMAVGNLLKGAGGEQVLLFASDDKPYAFFIDTWVLWNGLEGGSYSLGSAVSFLQSVVGIIMVIGSNKISKKVVGIGMW